VAKKSLGQTVLGWFVVREEEEGDAPAAAEETGEAEDGSELADDGADAMADEETQPYEKKKAPAAAPRPAPRPAPAAAAPPPLKLQGDVPQIAAGAAPDPSVFMKVYAAAEITEEEQARVEKALSLLESLPKDTPKAVRRQIVEASLKAFGIPIEEIIEASAQEIQALEAYIQQGERHTQDVLTDAGAQIEKLSARILEIKKLMELQIKTQQSTVRASNEQKLRIQSVLEFFGQEAVAKVVKASPKLIEPEPEDA
jgi:hypothetical protein